MSLAQGQIQLVQPMSHWCEAIWQSSVWDQFSLKSIKKPTHSSPKKVSHSSPKKVSYGMFLWVQTFNWYSASVTAVIYTISSFIGLCYNGTLGHVIMKPTPTVIDMDVLWSWTALCCSFHGCELCVLFHIIVGCKTHCPTGLTGIADHADYIVVSVYLRQLCCHGCVIFQSASINLCRHWPVGDLWPSRITISPWAEKVVH